jgi:predicted transcriptional regulator
MGDDSETAALMEIAVAQTSQYLNGLAAPQAPRRAQAILTTVFVRLLYRRAQRIERLDPIGDAAESMFSVRSWEDQVNNDLFLEKLTRHMGSRGVKILLLRRDGYTWDDVALALQSTQTAVKKCFWRAIKNAKIRLNIGARKKEAGASNSYSVPEDSRKRDEVSARRHGAGRG